MSTRVNKFTPAPEGRQNKLIARCRYECSSATFLGLASEAKKVVSCGLKGSTRSKHHAPGPKYAHQLAYATPQRNAVVSLTCCSILVLMGERSLISASEMLQEGRCAKCCNQPMADRRATISQISLDAKGEVQKPKCMSGCTTLAAPFQLNGCRNAPHSHTDQQHELPLILDALLCKPLIFGTFPFHGAHSQSSDAGDSPIKTIGIRRGDPLDTQGKAHWSFFFLHRSCWQTMHTE